jgi:citrate lyase subunit beta/citryl-CoA lyase
MGSTRIIPIISEVPISILQMPSYIDCSTRVAALNWGMEDLSAELGAASTRGPDGQITSPFRLARDLTLYTSVAAGVAPLDSVYPDFRDLAGLKAECEAAARDGFTGKAAIHPDQVAVINAAFTPSTEDIARAEEIVRLFREAPGAGVVALRGQMVDKPHLVRAERLLKRVGVSKGAT